MEVGNISEHLINASHWQEASSTIQQQDHTVLYGCDFQNGTILRHYMALSNAMITTFVQ